jgi:hypothetical protein
MRALVIYESMFGNTQRIAEAIADGMVGHARVVVHEVSEVSATQHPEFDLLVIGGPTHAWSMSRPRTREGARQQGAKQPVSAGIGIREWLGELPAARNDVVVATFDTRLNKPRALTGSAARAAAKRLRRLGYRVIDRESFVVTGSPGPLGPDELERARQWGVRLTRTAAPAEH